VVGWRSGKAGWGPCFLAGQNGTTLYFPGAGDERNFEDGLMEVVHASFHKSLSQLYGVCALIDRNGSGAACLLCYAMPC